MRRLTMLEHTLNGHIWTECMGNPFLCSGLFHRENHRERPQQHWTNEKGLRFATAGKETTMQHGNKYYVAYPKIWSSEDTWSKPTLDAAIDHAKEILNSQGGRHRDYCLIVKVVRIVRRKEEPIIVEVVP